MKELLHQRRTYAAGAPGLLRLLPGFAVFQRGFDQFFRYRVRHCIVGRIKLRGRLDWSSVGRVLVTGRKLMGGFDSISIDLQQADCANTAGLALLVEWSTWSVA